MTFKTSLAAAFGAMALLLPQPALAAVKWLRADTHNFIIYSAGNEAQLTQFAENVERFDALLRLRLHVPREDAPNRLTIYLLAQADDVAKMVEDKQDRVAGIYYPRSAGSFAIANRAHATDVTDLGGNTVLFHEYAHHFMFRYFNAPYPAWYVEGFAEFVSTASIKQNGEWMLGRPAYHRAYGLLETQKIPIESLMFDGALRKNVEQTDAYYGRAWLLVHMLAMDPARAGQVDKFMQAVLHGTPHREAAIASFGSLADLDAALDKYLQRSRTAAISSKRAVAVDGPIAISELDPVASQLVLLGLKRRVASDVTMTRNALQALADQSPNSADVWCELALAEQELGAKAADETAKRARLAASEAAADKALAIDPNHVRVNVLKARLMFARLEDKNNENPASWRDARAYLSKANAAAKLDPGPLAAFYESFSQQHRQPPKLASDGLALAFNLAPEATDLRAEYAFDLARQGNYDAAIKLAEVLAYDPHDGQQGASLLKQIKEMRDEDKPKGAASAKAGKPG